MTGNGGSSGLPFHVKYRLRAEYPPWEIHVTPPPHAPGLKAIQDYNLAILDDVSPEVTPHG
jgi:hypothetical protein